MHLVRVEPVIPPVALGVGLTPVTVQVGLIELVVRSMEVLLDCDLFEHLLNGHSVVLHVGSVQVPHNVDEFVGGQETVPVIIVESEQLLTLWL